VRSIPDSRLIGTRLQLQAGRLEAVIRQDLGDVGDQRRLVKLPGRGAIVQLGRWVLAPACEQARAWGDSFGAAAPSVSVNLARGRLGTSGSGGPAPSSHQEARARR
jgi:predicted signal transduction protein with EAL and GGDEF domain